MDFLHPLRMLALAVFPLTTVLFVAVLATGWRRWAAVLVAVPTAGVLAFELYSGWVGGNLTGLFWILSLPVVLVAVGGVSAAELITRVLRRRRASDGPTPAEESAPEPRGSDAP